MTSRMVRSVRRATLREPVVAASDATGDGGGLGADSVGDDPVLEQRCIMFPNLRT